MYYICPNIIKPLTKAAQLSYAELVGCYELQWFVSHFWGMQFRHFVASLQQHAQAAGADWQSQRYWVCTFANNQWSVEEELGSGCEQSSFYLALRSPSCRGTAMVLDEQAWPLTRSWCLFELTQTMLLTDHQRGRFDGLALCTSTGPLGAGGSVDVALGLARRLSALKLEDASASSAEDKQMIDDKVLGMPGGFPAVNQYIRAEMRDALLRVCDAFKSDLQEVVKALDQSSPLPEPDLEGGPSPSSSPRKRGSRCTGA